MAKSSLPLALDHFGTIKLSPSDEKKCQLFAVERLRKALEAEFAERHRQSKHKWRAMGEKNGIDMFYREDSQQQQQQESNGNSNSRTSTTTTSTNRMNQSGGGWHYKMVAKVRGSVRETVDGLYADNTTEMREINSHIHEQHLMDCQVLSVMRRRPEELSSSEKESCCGVFEEEEESTTTEALHSPSTTEEEDNGYKDLQFLGIKWLAFAPMSGSLHPEDFCLLEYSGFTDDKEGNQIGFRVLESIKIPKCPSQFDQLGFARSRMSRTCIFRNAERGMLDVHVIGFYDPIDTPEKSWTLNSNKRKGYIKKALQHLSLSVSKIPSCIEAKRISSRCFIPRSQWVPDSERKNCCLCQKRFSIIRPRHHCRLCGEIICGNCSIHRNVKTGLYMEQVKICKTCKVNARVPTMSSLSLGDFCSVSNSGPSGRHSMGGIGPMESDINENDFQNSPVRHHSTITSSTIDGHGRQSYNTTASSRNSSSNYSVCSSHSSNNKENTHPDQAVSVEFGGTLGTLAEDNASTNYAKKKTPKNSNSNEDILDVKYLSSAFRSKTEYNNTITESFEKMNQTIAEQEYLLNALKNAANTNTRTYSRQLVEEEGIMELEFKDDSDRFEILPN